MVNMRKHGFEPGWGRAHGPGNNIFCYFKEPVDYVVSIHRIDYGLHEASHRPKWPRTPELIDRWGTAGPPGADPSRHGETGSWMAVLGLGYQRDLVSP
jgi:hypothetical protein